MRPTARRGFTLIELMVALVILGLLATLAISSYMSMQSRSKEARVKGNCHAVQLAAEDFAVQNDGLYAASLADVTPLGSTVIDLLPSGNLLENPFTKIDSEPRDGAAGAVGETGYVGVDLEGDGLQDGYTITGFGYQNLVLTLTNGHQ
jgi:prepilin-type N-terminal cleavage/methylation domain-containing protein